MVELTALDTPAKLFVSYSLNIRIISAYPKKGAHGGQSSESMMMNVDV
jgi:hypothetical protein